MSYDQEVIHDAAEAMYLRRFLAFRFGPKTLREVDERTQQDYLGMAMAAFSVFLAAEEANQEKVAPTPIEAPGIDLPELDDALEMAETENPKLKLAEPDPELDDNIPF